MKPKILGESEIEPKCEKSQDEAEELQSKSPLKK